MLVWVFGLIGTAALACSSTIDFLFHVLHLRGRAYDGTSQERSSLQGEAHSFCVLHLHQHHAGAVSLCIFVCSCLCYFRLSFLCLSYQLKASFALRSGLFVIKVLQLHVVQTHNHRHLAILCFQEQNKADIKFSLYQVFAAVISRCHFLFC